MHQVDRERIHTLVDRLPDGELPVLEEVLRRWLDLSHSVEIPEHLTGAQVDDETDDPREAAVASQATEELLDLRRKRLLTEFSGGGLGLLQVIHGGGEVAWSVQAEKDLKHMGPKNAHCIRAAVGRYAGRCEGEVRRIDGTDPPQWRLRVGRHRVRFSYVDTPAPLIQVLGVTQREEAYR
jgi:mRNA-degrading endonuclease RelE of RelBE toxin-antitoxin system